MNIILEELASIRLGRFASVGAVGAIVDTASLAGLVEIGGVGPLLGKILSTEVSILIMFLLNERWTFPSRNGSYFIRLLKSNIVRVGGFLVGFAVLYMLMEWGNVWYLLANVIGIGTGFGLNYVAESLFTWEVHR